MARAAAKLSALCLSRNKCYGSVCPARPFHKLLAHGWQGSERRPKSLGNEGLVSFVGKRLDCCMLSRVSSILIDITLYTIYHLPQIIMVILLGECRNKLAGRRMLGQITRSRRRRRRLCPSYRPCSALIPGARTFQQPNIA